jgi:hypothetical protein
MDTPIWPNSSFSLKQTLVQETGMTVAIARQCVLELLYTNPRAALQMGQNSSPMGPTTSFPRSRPVTPELLEVAAFLRSVAASELSIVSPLASRFCSVNCCSFRGLGFCGLWFWDRVTLFCGVWFCGLWKTYTAPHAHWHL